MKNIKALSMVYVLFVCWGKFLGMVFWDNFSIESTIVVIGGAISAIMWYWNPKQLKAFTKTVILLIVSLITLIACAYEHYIYFILHNSEF